MIRIFLVLPAAFLLASIQEKFDKSKHPWARWKEGSRAKFKMVQEMGGARMEGEITFKLSKVTERDYAVSVAVDMMGNRNATEDTEALPENAGEETLTIEGKKIECTIWKSTGKQGGKETERKVWVPKGKDCAVRIVSKGARDIELVAVKLSGRRREVRLRPPRRQVRRHE